MVTDMILMSLFTKSLLYLQKGQNLCLKAAEAHIWKCWENNSTFALLLTLCHQTLCHVGDEIKTTVYSQYPELLSNDIVHTRCNPVQ